MHVCNVCMYILCICINKCVQKTILILKVANTKFALLDLSGRFQHFHQALQNFIRGTSSFELPMSFLPNVLKLALPLRRRSRRWPRMEPCSAAKTGRSSGSAAERPRSPLHLASAHSPTPLRDAKRESRRAGVTLVVFD